MIPYTRTLKKAFTVLDELWVVSNLLTLYPELERYLPFNQWFLIAKEPCTILINRDPNQEFPILGSKEHIGDDESLVGSFQIKNDFAGANEVWLILKKNKLFAGGSG